MGARVKRYLVEAPIKIDCPDERGLGLPRPPAGTIQRQDFRCLTYREALALRHEILLGEYDFASEYVKAVAVFEVDPDDGGIVCVVRKRLRRDERGTVWYDERQST
jgi:hypothetical protein